MVKATLIMMPTPLTNTP